MCDAQRRTSVREETENRRHFRDGGSAFAGFASTDFVGRDPELR